MIHYHATGAGQHWLVFVHGLTCDNSDWCHQLAAFQSSHNCVTVDLRGHGLSGAHSGPLDIETHASDVIEILRALKISNAGLA